MSNEEVKYLRQQQQKIREADEALGEVYRATKDESARSATIRVSCFISQQLERVGSALRETEVRDPMMPFGCQRRRAALRLRLCALHCEEIALTHQAGVPFFRDENPKYDDTKVLEVIRQHCWPSHFEEAAKQLEEPARSDWRKAREKLHEKGWHGEYWHSTEWLELRDLLNSLAAALEVGQEPLPVQPRG